MPSPLPDIQLTHGQLLWTLNLGRPPTPKLTADIRYLKRLGVPFRDKERGEGRGSSTLYTYIDLIECGVALYAIRRRMRPKEIAYLLNKYRAENQPSFREAWLNLPENVLEQPWIETRSPPPNILGLPERLLALHDFNGDYSGTMLGLAPGQLLEGDVPGDWAGWTADGTPLIVVRLGRLVTELVAWAQRAPLKQRGRPRATGKTQPTKLGGV